MLLNRPLSHLISGLCLVATLAIAAPSRALDLAIPAERIKVKSDSGASARVFSFETRSRAIRVEDFDPERDRFSFVLNGIADKDTSSGVIELDPLRWKQIRNDDGKLVGYRYLDRSGSRGGVRRVVFKRGELKIRAKGANWPWKPRSPQDALWMNVTIASDLLCSKVDNASADRVSQNQKNLFSAQGASAPDACADQLCGNGIVEAGEQCDDGNRERNDGCRNNCKASECKEPDFDSTYDAIQALIFENASYACDTAACHGSALQGELDLRAAASYDDLVDVPAVLGGLRVDRGKADDSLLYTKMAKKTLGLAGVPGSGMPLTGSQLTVDELEAVRLWIEAGAGQDDVVPGTDSLLRTCLPEVEGGSQLP